MYKQMIFDNKTQLGKRSFMRNVAGINYAQTYLFITNSKPNQGDPNLSCMELRNRLTNQVSEDWYIGSIFGRSVMEKNSTEA